MSAAGISLVRHSALLVARPDEGDLGAAFIQGVEQVIGMHPRNAEYSVDATANEALDNGLTGGDNLRHGWTRVRSNGDYTLEPCGSTLAASRMRFPGSAKIRCKPYREWE
jgi:hypothetical protein